MIMEKLTGLSIKAYIYHILNEIIMDHRKDFSYSEMEGIIKMVAYISNLDNNKLEILFLQDKNLSLLEKK